VKRTIRRSVAWLFVSTTLHAYSVLSHEAIIDSAWDADIRPTLLKRFPNATPEELNRAHAHAYGGCIIQDMGYYPFGSRHFSDLAHYVRSGDFLVNLLKDAQTLDEYAFALGALAHYTADRWGHSVAVNRAVPMQYPKLAQKFGPVVTYADDKASHLKVEFAFDVLQVARGSYAPQAYHDFIGFDTSPDVLRRAFFDTYGVQLDHVFSDLDLSLSTYRHTVSVLIPRATRVAWDMKKDEFLKAQPTMTRQKFVYNLSRASYRKEWKDRYRSPGARTKFWGFVIRILPKVGPLKALAFKAPTPQTESMFEASFNRTLGEYRRLLAEQREGQLKLENRDFDTGEPTRPGEYPLADEAYARLARELAEKKSMPDNRLLVRDLLDFFKDLNQPFATKKHSKEWRETVAAVEKLRSAARSAGAAE
jgi:hypothetical protein